MKKLMITILILCSVLLVGPLYLLLSGTVKLAQDWRTASHAPAHLLKPLQVKNKAAVVLLSARVFSWRGLFSTHNWIAVKTASSSEFTIYQVIGWNQYYHKPIVDVSYGIPDRLWYGNPPQIRGLITGPQAARLIPRIEQAVKNYPYAQTYRAWPGPNSNTFISYILQQVPSLELTTPLNALGRDYQTRWSLQHFSLLGVIGWKISPTHAYINLLGLTLGLSWHPWGVIIPGVGLKS